MAVNSCHPVHHEEASENRGLGGGLHPSSLAEGTMKSVWLRVTQAAEQARTFQMVPPGGLSNAVWMIGQTLK